jgi:hypothetical protein
MEATNFTTTILVEKAQKKYSMPSTMFELVCNEIKKQIVALTTLISKSDTRFKRASALVFSEISIFIYIFVKQKIHCYKIPKLL